VIMASQNEEEIRLEENPNQGLPKEPRHNNKGSSTTQVLETTRNLILELQVFKEDNEKLKKRKGRLEINKRNVVAQPINKEESKR
jgi:predicted ATP-dependent serine protease